MFPQDFLWGAVLSAHQVEGHDFNTDWWRWEQRPSRIRNADTSEIAADHYQRYAEDVDLARRLGMNAMLVALSWARIQPAPDRFDKAALAHYQGVMAALRSHGIEPVCALQHVTLPAWFADLGGWENGAAAQHFRRYAERAAEALGAACQRWIPLAEPSFWAAMAYQERQWPARRQALGFWLAMRNLAHSYLAAYRAIHAHCPGASVGLSVRAEIVEPEDPYSAWDLRTARAEQHRQRHGFSALVRLLAKGAPDFDFLGVSYYGRKRVRFAPLRPGARFARGVDAEGRPAASDVTEPYALGLARALAELEQYQVPLLITGNGVAAEDDRVRASYLLDHTTVLGQCLKRGMNVRGYFHRAFLDGFEWTDGYTARYGLVHVDRGTLARTPNPSAYLYKDICESGEIRPGAIARCAPGWTPPEDMA
jgi:beta-glucosidase